MSSEWLDEIWPIEEPIIKSSYKISYDNLNISLKNSNKTGKISSIFGNKIRKISKQNSDKIRNEWKKENLEGIYEIFLRLKEKFIEYGLRLKTGNKWDDFLNELIELCYLNTIEKNIKVDISKVENGKEFIEEFTLEFEDLFNEILKWGINRGDPVYLDFPVNLVRNLMVLYIDIDYYMKDESISVSTEESEIEDI
jgi:hypothetical protein